MDIKKLYSLILLFCVVGYTGCLMYSWSKVQNMQTTGNSVMANMPEVSSSFAITGIFTSICYAHILSKEYLKHKQSGDHVTHKQAKDGNVLGER